METCWQVSFEPWAVGWLQRYVGVFQKLREVWVFHPPQKIRQDHVGSTFGSYLIIHWKLTCPLKIDGWKMFSLLKWSLFRGHVSFQGCNSLTSRNLCFVLRCPESLTQPLVGLFFEAHQLPNVTMSHGGESLRLWTQHLHFFQSTNDLYLGQSDLLTTIRCHNSATFWDRLAFWF